MIARPTLRQPGNFLLAEFWGQLYTVAAVSHKRRPIAKIWKVDIFNYIAFPILTE